MIFLSVYELKLSVFELKLSIYELPNPNYIKKKTSMYHYIIKYTKGGALPGYHSDHAFLHIFKKPSIVSTAPPVGMTE